MTKKVESKPESKSEPEPKPTATPDEVDLTTETAAPSPEPTGDPATSSPTTESTGDPTPADMLVEIYNNLQEQVKTITSQLSTLQKQLRKAKKDSLTLMSSMEKRLTKNAKKRKTPQPSKIRYTISPNLASFLGEDEAATLTRRDAEDRILSYIKESGLANPDNGSQILPDDKLSAICATGNEPFLYIGDFKKNIKHNFLDKIKEEDNKPDTPDDQ